MSKEKKTVNKWSNRMNRRGSKPKRIGEMAPSTRLRYIKLGKLPYYSTFRDSIRDLFEYPISDSARLTWVRLQPLFANRVAYGYLVDDRTGKPIQPEFLAKVWRREQSEIARDLEELREFDLLSHEDGVWLDLAMSSYVEELENDNVPNDNDLDDSPQQSRNKLSQSRVKQRTGQESIDCPVLSSGISSAPSATPSASRGVAESLADDGKADSRNDSGSVHPLEEPTKAIGSVAAEPKPAPAEPTEQEIEAKRKAEEEAETRRRRNAELNAEALKLRAFPFIPERAFSRSKENPLLRWISDHCDTSRFTAREIVDRARDQGGIITHMVGDDWIGTYGADHSATLESDIENAYAASETEVSGQRAF